MKFQNSNLVREYNAFNKQLDKEINLATKNQSAVNVKALNTRFTNFKNRFNAEIKKLNNAAEAARNSENDQMKYYLKSENFRNAKQTWARNIQVKLNTLKSLTSSYSRLLNNSSVDIHVHNFLGLGCSLGGTKQNMVMNSSVFKNNKTQKELHDRIVTFQHCNPSMKKTVKHVALQCVSPLDPRLSEYLKRQIKYVTKSIENPVIKKVYVCGLSYGGLVVNMICRALNNHPNASKIDATTFGAIYIAPPSKLTNITIRQFMRADDVALHCMRTLMPPVRTLMTKPSSPNTNALFDTNKQVNNRSKGIIWLKPTTGYRALIPTVVGTRSEWREHGNYSVSEYMRRRIKETAPPRNNV